MNINEIIKVFPLALDKEDEDVINLALEYLPYSTGFEIECNCNEDRHKRSLFQTIGLLDCDVNNNDEQRFRITNGIEGLNQLFKIAELLPETMNFNLESGIHYHIDCTDIWDKLDKDVINLVSKYILDELDTWEYKGNYNQRKCEFSESRYWTRFKTFTKTMEFRIGEMTFDYELLFKRITHCNEIVRNIKEVAENPTEYLKILYNIDDNDIIQNRRIKL